MRGCKPRAPNNESRLHEPATVGGRMTRMGSARKVTARGGARQANAGSRSCRIPVIKAGIPVKDEQR